MKPHSLVDAMKSSNRDNTQLTNSKSTFLQLPANACFNPEPAALIQRDNKTAIKTARCEGDLFRKG